MFLLPLLLYIPGLMINVGRCITVTVTVLTAWEEELADLLGVKALFSVVRFLYSASSSFTYSLPTGIWCAKRHGLFGGGY